MKKIILSFALLLCMCVGVSAQAKIIFDGYPDINITVKRCYVRGNDCILDAVITNHTRYDLRAMVGVGDGLFGTDLTAYDDEGNVYNKYGIRGTFGDSSFGGGTYSSSSAVTIPRDVSVKIQFKIKEINEFASMITSLICNFRGMSDEAYGKATLQMKNIPITRE
ncbi:MAG: hypothetical protein II901_04625 [Paludibacteraceae bacterium]|nr:hypothetical protein [Paludibacteraceae bacterium]